MRRVRLLDWLDQEPVARARVEVLEDDEGSPALASLVRARFLDYLHELFGMVHQAAPTVALGRTPREVSFVVSSVLHLDLAQKQALLAQPTTDERLQALLDVIARETARVHGLASVAAHQGKRYYGGICFSVN